MSRTLSFSRHSPRPPRTACPAAEGLAGPPVSGPSIVCKVITREMSLVDYILESRNIEGMAHITVEQKPTVVAGFCCGQGHPKQPGEGKRARDHFTFCPIWEAHEELEAKRLMGEADHRVFEGVEQPKILGQDPEVLANLLGLDPEQVIREEQRYAAEHGHDPSLATGDGLGTRTKSGVDAMEDIAEWED